MATITWSITNLLTEQTPDPNYVVNASWRVTATESGKSFFQDGGSTFAQTQQSNFIPYDQLTPEIVLGWVQAQLGAEVVANCEKTCTTQLGYLLNPAPEPQPQPVPWG
jgi:hypothetical protein